MQEYRLENFTRFHEIIENYDVRSVIFRGMKSVEYPLMPKIGRVVPPESAGSRQENEHEILRLFKERAFQYLDFTPASDWDWLALGQQYGLPTRLLDWTENPLVACYFAVDQDQHADSVIYAYHKESYIDVDRHPDPFEYKEVGKFIPRHLTPRITTQGGLFTVHPNPYEPFAAEEMDRIVIPRQVRREFKHVLNKYGVNRFSLFPGLDGLAAHIEWLQSKRE